MRPPPKAVHYGARVDHFSEHEADELAGRVGRLVSARRRTTGLSAAELAERSGLSRTIVSRIERGEGNPSIGTLWRLSKALGVSLGDLLGDPEPPRTRVLRAGEGEAIGDPSGMVGRLLHGDARERRTEIYAIELPAGARRDSSAHAAGVEELVLVTRGRLAVGPEPVGAEGAGALDVLGPGDAIWFASDAPHRYETAGTGPCAFTCCMFYPSATP